MQVICGNPTFTFDPNATYASDGTLAEPKKSGRLSGGGIAGVVVGTLGGVVLALIGGLFGYKSYQEYKVGLPKAMDAVVMPPFCWSPIHSRVQICTWQSLIYAVELWWYNCSDKHGSGKPRRLRIKLLQHVPENNCILDSPTYMKS